MPLACGRGATRAAHVWLCCMVVSTSCVWYRCLAPSNNESSGGADPSDPVGGAERRADVVGVTEGRGPEPLCGAFAECNDCFSCATRSASRLVRGERAMWVDGVAAESIGVAGRRCAGGTAPRYAMTSRAVLPVPSAAA